MPEPPLFVQWVFRPSSPRSHRCSQQASILGTAGVGLVAALALMLTDQAALAASLTGTAIEVATPRASRCRGAHCRTAPHGSTRPRRLTRKARQLVQLQPGSGYTVLRPRRAWGTKKTVETLGAVLKAYHARFPDGPMVYVHDLSQRAGGPIKPHKSHRRGRDVDIRFICTGAAEGGECRFSPEHNWFIVQELIATGQIEYVFTAYTAQRKLYRYARTLGLSRAALAELFQYPRPRSQREGLIRHEPNHRCHFHVRFKRPDEPPELFAQHPPSDHFRVVELTLR